MGLCLNGRSECPDRYRRSAMNAYIRRALTHCSTWATTSAEIDNATQTLVNNGYSNREITSQIRKAIDKWYLHEENTARSDQQTDIKIFYKNQWHRDYKKDERAIRDIINSNVKPVNSNHSVKLIIYYKNRKSSNLILKNNPYPPVDTLRKRNVVYQFKCPVMECSHEYIGMTTMRLSKRISCHVQEGAIFLHYRNSHNCKPVRNDLIKSINIIDCNKDPKRLRYLEALHILQLKPSLNCTQEPLLLPTMSMPRPSP